jgi:hypothetical protein
MKTLLKIPTIDVGAEKRWLSSSSSRCRATQLFHRIHTPKELYLCLGDDPPSSLEDVIAEVEAVMLSKGYAQWVLVGKSRKLKVCDRVIDWAIRVIESLDQGRAAKLYFSLTRIDEIDYWRRISLEFGLAEYEALTRKLMP